ncbi:MAG: hypothetical protein B6I25_03430 [Planctomycetales bacterium 4572_13]|nr:MAG: hypothetical protein B6I25_03430 [Planctomycetales bacterium 4572_13]
MPGGNGTGPAGMGPMTGRGVGFCAGYNTPGYTHPIGGRGMGMGRGRGMGMGRGFGRGFAGAGNAGAYPVPVGQPLTQEQELEGLKGQAESLENSLDQIKARIEALQSQK